jgi:hypothetical protein
MEQGVKPSRKIDICQSDGVQADQQVAAIDLDRQWPLGELLI